MSMKDYTEIKSPEELDQFLHEKVTFRDGMLKEMQIINRSYVMENKSMNMDHGFDARILFQMQWDPVAFELVCIGVNYLNATGAEEFMGSSGKFIESPEQYGNNEHLGSQVPSVDMVLATKLENNWRQCGECCNIWEVSSALKIATCPSCNKVTCVNNT